MNNKIATIGLLAIVIIAITLAVATSGVLSSVTDSKSVPSGGTLVQASVNLGIYSNAACTQSASFVDWGALRPGDSTTNTIWIRNQGNTNTTITLNTVNWSPSNVYPAISMTWNREGKTLAPNEVIQATLTLTVSASINSSITEFSFNIQITGTI